MEKAKVYFIRTSQAVNSGRNFKICINDQEYTTISNGEEKIIELAPGRHNIFLKIDWCKSENISIDLKAGEEKKFICISNELEFWKQILSYFNYKYKYINLEIYTDQKIDYEEETWDNMKAKGMVSYVFNIGIIQFGLPVGAIIILFNILSNFRESGIYDIVMIIITNIGLSLIGGVIFGTFMWFLSKIISD